VKACAVGHDDAAARSRRRAAADRFIIVAFFFSFVTDGRTYYKHRRHSYIGGLSFTYFTHMYVHQMTYLFQRNPEKLK